MAPAMKKNSTSNANASSAIHPPYFQMISEAITSLKDRTGSSQPAIAKFIEEQYKTALPPNFKKILSVQLKKFVKSEKLTKVKNSYKVSAVEKVKLPANSAKEMQKKKDVKRATGTEKSKPKKVIAKKAVEKAAKTKRLSQVKTPEGLKKKPKVPNVQGSGIGGKLKRLSQVAEAALKKRKVRTAGNIKYIYRADLITPLVHLLQNAKFEVKQVAAWAISNIISDATHEHIKLLASDGCIKPLCDVLVCPDPRIVIACLEGLENILKVGEDEKNLGNTEDVNVFAQMIDDAEGLEKLDYLQNHDNNEISEKAVKILATLVRGIRLKV